MGESQKYPERCSVVLAVLFIEHKRTLWHSGLSALTGRVIMCKYDAALETQAVLHCFKTVQLDTLWVTCVHCRWLKWLLWMGPALSWALVECIDLISSSQEVFISTSMTMRYHMCINCYTVFPQVTSMSSSPLARMVTERHSQVVTISSLYLGGLWLVFSARRPNILSKTCCGFTQLLLKARISN